MVTEPVLELRHLRACERAKRLVVLGLVVLAYAVWWLLISWRASRVGETECAVERVADRGMCHVVNHAEDGQEHSGVWDDCNRPTRWAPVPVGTRMHCFYYRSAPDVVFFEPRPLVLWCTPWGVGFVVLGSGLLAAAGLVRGRSPAPSTPSGPPLLVLPRSAGTGCLQWIFAGPFAFLGSVIAVLWGYVQWYDTGEEWLASLFVTWFGHGVTFLGLLGLFYRSGLVFDARRGVFFSWWGVGWPWFRRYEALSSLQGADASAVSARGTRRELVLHLARAKVLRFDWPGTGPRAGELQRVVKQIREYTGLPDHGAGLAPPSIGSTGPPGTL